MRYLVRHPENLGVFLIVLGVVCFSFRKKIAELRTPPAKERMVAVGDREMVEGTVKLASLLSIACGVLLAGLKFLFA